MIALKGARWLGLVENARTGPNELLVELPLMIAAQPALTIQGLQAPATLIDAIKRTQTATHAPALAKLLHGTQHSLGLGRLVRGVVCGIEML